MQDVPITVKTADEWLNITLQRDCLPAAIKYTPALVGDQESIGAIADFIYNLGASRYKTSTLRRRLNNQEWDEAQHEIMRWTRANGRVLKGLQLRRSAEAEYLPK
jgi:lysozyme